MRERRNDSFAAESVPAFFDMKYRIPVKDELSRAEKRRRTIKWLLLILTLIVLYVIMRAGIFDAWQPVFIIPLAVAVSMYESELSSCVFALFCGYFIDIASDYVFGFSAVWLMLVCLAASLFVRNLIRVNMINFCVLSLFAILAEFSMDYLFNVFIWNVPGGNIILTASIIPTAVSTFIVSPLMYLWVGFIEDRMSAPETVDYYENPDDKEQSEQN